jgi:hypothetical protein
VPSHKPGLNPLPDKEITIMVITSFPSKRASFYADVPDEKWNSWRWQLSNRINTVEEFEKVIPLTESERKALRAPGSFGSISRPILFL